MSEWDWVTGNCPRVMLAHFGGTLTERKRRLFACGCCHTVRHLITDERSWQAVLLAERYADDLATAAELEHISHLANSIWLDMDDPVRRLACEAAFRSAIVYKEELWQIDLAWADAALA